jgi:hypothetical protein
MELTLMLMALWTTVTFVSLDNPAAFVTFNVTQFVPLFNGKFSTQSTPDRSTSPLTVFVSPFVSVIVAETVADGSSTVPRSVKLLPHICIPFVGHVSPTTGFVAVL